MQIDSRKKVAVLRGGPSPEYEISIASGGHILTSLPREHYEPLDIFISQEGAWHENGVEKSPESILKRADVVLSCLRGSFGEDGSLQRMLEQFKVPYVGSEPVASALGSNKVATKQIYRKNGIKTPFWIAVDGEELNRGKIFEIYRSVPMPFAVKPASASSSLGMRVAHSKQELEEAVVAALEYSPTVLVEEFIHGMDASSAALEGWRGQEIYATLPVESTLLSETEKKMVEKTALLAHQLLGLRHYSKSDFVVHPKRGVFILETNPSPDWRRESHIHSALSYLGAKFSDFLHHILTLALKRK